MDALDLVFGFRGFFENRDAIRLAGQRDLGAETDAGIGVGEEFGEFGGLAFIEAFGDEFRGVLRLVGQIHFIARADG